MVSGRQILLQRFNAPLELRDVTVPSPEPDELLIHIDLAGVCGSDVHTWHGEVPRVLPIVMGHEGVGTLAALGKDVTSDSAGGPVKEGDRVYWSPARACNRCRACAIEKDPSACDRKGVYGPVGGRNRNSYADYAMLSLGGTFYKIPDDTPSEAVIAFGCAMPTILQAFDRLGPVQVSSAMVVQGCGPVGLAAILMARCSGCHPIIALDRFEDRLRIARTIGATHTIVVSPRQTVEARRDQIHGICGGRGADVVVEATGNLQAFSEGIQFVARNGRYLVVGLWAGEGTAALDPHHVLRNNIRIIGSAYAAPSHYYRAVQIARQSHRDIPMASVVTSRFTLDNALQALHAVERGQAGKAVLSTIG
jgi:threonine dehydrogenase-like Zn-dependent dehydrogenase